MKKIIMTLFTVALAFLCGNIKANAIEMIIYQLSETTDVKEQPYADSKTLVTLEEGTPIWQIEEGEKWIKIRYQEYTGYILSDVIEEQISEKDIEEEFAYMEKVVDEIYQETVKIQRENTEKLVWKAGILILVIATLGCGIFWQVKKSMIKKKESNED